MGHARGMVLDIGVFTGHGLCASQLLLCSKVPYPSKVSGLNMPLLSPVSEGWNSGHVLNGSGSRSMAGWQWGTAAGLEGVLTRVEKGGLWTCSYGYWSHILFIIAWASPPHAHQIYIVWEGIWSPRQGIPGGQLPTAGLVSFFY